MTDPDEHERNPVWWASASDAILAAGMVLSADEATSDAAWREFYRRHLGAVKVFIDTRGRDSDTDVCDGLLVETVMRIHRGAESFRDRGPGTFRSWCIKIAQRVLQDLWRGRLTELDGGLSPKFGVTDLVPFEEIEARFGGGLVTGSFAEHEALCTRGPDEEEPTMSVEAQLAAEAFATLSSIDQTVLWCKVMHEDSDARVSEITGKPVDQVRKIRFKALDRLIRRFQRLMAAAGQEAL